MKCESRIVEIAIFIMALIPVLITCYTGATR